MVIITSRCIQLCATESQLEASSSSIFEKVADEESVNVLPAIEVKPVDLDLVVDDEKQVVIVDVPVSDPNGSIDSSSEVDDIQVDAEPIRLLAQLYAKHLHNAKAPESIPRPTGFYPNNLRPADGDFDLFRRSYLDTVEITNPEYVDLRAFLLTNRFRSQKPSVSDAPSNFQLAYNQYYNLPLAAPVLLTRDTLDKLPESLKAAAFGLPSIDGPRDIQVSPTQKKQHEQQEQQAKLSIGPSPYSRLAFPIRPYFYPSTYPVPFYSAYPLYPHVTY